MAAPSEIDMILIDRIRSGDQAAWSDLIARYEGRLLAFTESRLSNRSAAEDIVQDAFIGFLNSLPNFDGARPVESYLFSICAYKLTDHLRREGRRPTIPLSGSGRSASSSNEWQLPASGMRGASSIARSGERRGMEEQAIEQALAQQVDKWKDKSDYAKLKCIELIFVVGLPNKDVADQLGLTEQQVANYKSDFLIRTKTLVGRQNLNTEIFPELSTD
jgi:RNA polymerase sigma-70 factor (ECF subfamily)